MRPNARVRFARLGAALLLVAALTMPSLALPTRAANSLILRVGTTQDLDSMNPFQTALAVGYEAFTLNYDLLVNFDEMMNPAPGFAESWTQSSDGLTWTFKIHPGMTWSDGKPATSEDARFTLQTVLDAVNAGASIGLGYLDPYVKYAAIKSVAAPDPTTLVVTTTRANDRVLAMFIPILPKHVWGTYTYKTIADFPNKAPVVGSGPYQAVEWQTGQFMRFARNESYWGSHGAPTEVDIRFFPTAQDTMVQAFKNKELDYIHNPTAAQFIQLKAQKDVVALSASANGFTELGFNTYGQDIAGGGASTTALRDPAFRDALGYAIDKPALVDKVLNGFGTAGTTQVPPSQVKWYVAPTDIRTFDIGVAKQKLDAAGYPTDASGNRLDKQGKVIALRLYFPNTDSSYATSAQFITDWFGQLGIKVHSQALDEGTLTDLEVGPSDGVMPKTKLNYDMFIWGWVGDPDPNTLLAIFQTEAIGNSSDSQFSNPTYDTLFTQQNEAPDAATRKTLMAQMQQIMYDQAPYHILYYDNVLDVYRTDRFSNWQTQPPTDGTPLFVNGSYNYTILTDATASPTPAPSPSAGASAAPGSSSPGASTTPTPAPSPAPGGGGASGGDNTLLIVAAAIVIVVVVGGGYLLMRRRPAQEEE